MEFFSSLMHRDGPVMWPILLRSLVSVAISAERMGLAVSSVAEAVAATVASWRKPRGR